MKTIRLCVGILALAGVLSMTGCGSSSNTDIEPKASKIDPNLKGPVSRGGPGGGAGGGPAVGGGTTSKGSVEKP